MNGKQKRFQSLIFLDQGKMHMFLCALLLQDPSSCSLTLSKQGETNQVSSFEERFETLSTIFFSHQQNKMSYTHKKVSEGLKQLLRLLVLFLKRHFKFSNVCLQVIGYY